MEQLLEQWDGESVSIHRDRETGTWMFVCVHSTRLGEAAGGSGDTAPDTAVGVLHGIQAACRYAFGSDDLSLRSVLVQGAGGVGGRLLELLMEADAGVIATDIDTGRLAALGEKGIQV